MSMFKDLSEPKSGTTSWWKLFAFAAFTGLLLALFDILDGVPFLGDVDDKLREIQIRGLVEGGAWYDRTLPFVQMPGPYVSPWSRLVDIPYTLITWSLAWMIGEDMALQVAFYVWPLVLLLLFCGFFVKTLIILLDDTYKIEPIWIVGCIFSMGFTIWEFTPSRIDHHNVQLVCFMMTFYGLSLWSRKGAIFAGFGIVLSVVVGLELLPLIAFILLAVSVCWIFDRSGTRQFAFALGATMVVLTPLAALAFLGPTEMVSVECDAFSAPFILALMGYGLITASFVLFLGTKSWVARGGALCVAGLVLIAFLVVKFPVCLDGPYKIIDPLSREYWLMRVGQELSVLEFFRFGRPENAFMFAVSALLLILAAPSVFAETKRGRSAIIIIYGVAVIELVLAFIQTRHMRFATAFAPVFLPFVVGYISNQKLKGLVFWGSVVAAAFSCLVVLYILVPQRPRTYDTFDFLTFNYCPDGDPKVLWSVPPGRIMTTAILGIDLAKDLPPGMSVAGIPFHRSSPGIRRILQTLFLGDSEARKKAAAPFDYVLVCRGSIPKEIGADNLFTHLVAGEDWPGLIRVPSDSDNPYQLFRIDHDKFR